MAAVAARTFPSDSWTPGASAVRLATKSPPRLEPSDGEGIYLSLSRANKTARLHAIPGPAYRLTDARTLSNSLSIFSVMFWPGYVLSSQGVANSFQTAGMLAFFRNASRSAGVG